MTEQTALEWLKVLSSWTTLRDEPKKACEMAIKALKKQIELRKNCEGSCSDCKYRGESQCANDLLGTSRRMNDG